MAQEKKGKAPKKQAVVPAKSINAGKKPKSKLKQEVFSTTIDTARAKNVQRSGYDEMLLQSFLRKKRITDIQKVTIERNYIPDKKDLLESVITVDYLTKE